LPHPAKKGTEMPYPNKVPMADKIYCGTIADISTANSAAHIPIWGQG